MANITITIDNSQVDLLAAALGYQSTVSGQPNPVSPRQHIRRYFRQSIKSLIIAQDLKIKQSTLEPIDPNVDVRTDLVGT